MEQTPSTVWSSPSTFLLTSTNSGLTGRTGLDKQPSRMPQTSRFLLTACACLFTPPWGFNVGNSYAQQHAFGNQIFTSMTYRHPPHSLWAVERMHLDGAPLYIVPSGAWGVQTVSLAWHWDMLCMTVPGAREELVLSVRETTGMTYHGKTRSDACWLQQSGFE